LTTLQALKDSDAIEVMDRLLQPATIALASLPVVVLAESASFYVRQGQPVRVANVAAAPTTLVQMQTASGELLGVGEILDDGRITPRRLVNQQSPTHEA
jgi:tRNA pseudouridine55 synthase